MEKEERKKRKLDIRVDDSREEKLEKIAAALQDAINDGAKRIALEISFKGDDPIQEEAAINQYLKALEAKGYELEPLEDNENGNRVVKITNWKEVVAKNMSK